MIDIRRLVDSLTSQSVFTPGKSSVHFLCSFFLVPFHFAMIEHSSIIGQNSVGGGTTRSNTETMIDPKVQHSLWSQSLYI